MECVSVDLDLRGRATLDGGLHSCDARRGRRRIVQRADLEQKWNRRRPAYIEIPAPGRIESYGGAEVALRQIGRSGHIGRRDGECHRRAAVRPADETDAFTDDEGLRLQIAQSAIG